MSALTQDQRIAAARKAYSLVQLRKDYPDEYQAGMEAFNRGLRLMSDCPFDADSLQLVAWQAGWRQARRDAGE